MRSWVLSRFWLLFILGLFIKLGLGIFFASHYLRDYFIPFVNFFVASGLKNPYQVAIAQGLEQQFPYPALMLYILSVAGYAVKFFDATSVNVTLLCYRLILLIADTALFLILLSWLKDKRYKVLFLYWYSPVLIYISYVYGQLDVIPISLLFISIYQLFKSRFLGAALLMGLALATKTHLILVVPFLFLYHCKQHTSYRALLYYFLVMAVVFVAANIVYLSNAAFMQMVFNNQEQLKFWNPALHFDTRLFYLLPTILCLLFLKGFSIIRYSRDLFLIFLGFLFSAVLIFIPPMPGWYYWIIPFFAYFYVKQSGKSIALFLTLQFAYLIYFFLPHRHLLGCFVLPFLPATLKLIENFSFTFLQLMLAVNCFWIYQRGVERYRKVKLFSAPFLIGIGGDSGVGKSLLADQLEAILGKNYTTVLHGDDMHKWERGAVEWDNFTHLNPQANHLHAEVIYLQEIKAGKAIQRPHYDHNSGKFTTSIRIKSKNVLIFEGLHPFYLNSQRNLYDFKIFIQPEKNLAYHWKIVRDTTRRNYSVEKILAQIQKRESDAEKYIYPQANYADLTIIPRVNQPIKEVGNSSESVEVYYELKLKNHFFLDDLLFDLQTCQTLIIKHYCAIDDTQVIVLQGTITATELKPISKKHLNELFLFTDIEKNNWQCDSFSVVVLITLYCILKQVN